MPANVKPMNGTPWELHELPRQMHQNPDTADFGAPPVRKRRAPKAQDSPLGTISERPHPPVAQRQDAATSTTELDTLARDADDAAGPRKVQKGQINALAKMLSALRR